MSKKLLISLACAGLVGVTCVALYPIVDYNLNGQPDHMVNVKFQGKEGDPLVDTIRLLQEDIDTQNTDLKFFVSIEALNAKSTRDFHLGGSFLYLTTQQLEEYFNVTIYYDGGKTYNVDLTRKQ